MQRIIVNIFRRGAAAGQLEIAPSSSVPGVSHFDDYRTHRFPTAHAALSDVTPIGSTGYAVTNAFTAFRDRWEHPTFRSAAWLTVGNSNPTRSHTYEQNRIDGGGYQFAALNSGWVNRLAQIAPLDYPLDLLSLGNGAARSIIGVDYPYAAAISTIPTIISANAARAMALMTGTPATPEAAAGRANAMAVGETVDTLNALDVPPVSAMVGNYPTGWASKMRDIARLINAGIGSRYITCDYSGWDHHKDMGGSPHSPSGPREHAEMLAAFNGGVAALIADLEASGNAHRVLITTQTEFHRTMRQNGGEGADHGFAGHAYAWGASVSSGLYGAPLDYRENSSIYADPGSWQDPSNNRLLKFTLDYRDFQRMQAEWLLGRQMTAAEIEEVWEYTPEPVVGQWGISHV